MSNGKENRGVGDAPILLVVAFGGAIGSVARYGLSLALPAEAERVFPWATFAVNVAGCLLIGMLMVRVTESGAHRLLRPFLGVGVLGGFTTMSTYVVDTLTLLDFGRYGVALLYVLSTLLCTIPAVLLGMRLMRTLRGRVRG